jgi:putative PIN family toxin of toxin-antitoxin system
MIPAVFDCMVFLQAATRRTGPAAACLALVDDGHVGLFVSPKVLEEIHDVLKRPAIRKKFPAITDQDVLDFIEHIHNKATTVEQVPAVFQLPRDPDDEPYVDLAAAAGAAFLVTRDKDLLSLTADEAFRRQFPTLSILDPKAFLDHVRSSISNDTGGTKS